MGALENLQLLSLTGSNQLENLDFLKTMKSLKTFVLGFNVLDGDLSLCDNVQDMHILTNKRHYNRKHEELPKATIRIKGNESIEEWRRLE